MKSNTRKILVIEDEKPLARALELKLMHDGFEVKKASNGEEGLHIIKNEVFDLILCDLVMPKLDGFTVLETLKHQKAHTPVIILTNLSQSEDEKRVMDLGAVGFFIKSNTPVNKIVEHVKEQLGLN